MTREEILKTVQEKFETEVNAYFKKVNEMINNKTININTLDNVTSMSLSNITNGYKEACSLWMNAVSDEGVEPDCPECKKKMKRVKKNKESILCSHLE